MGKYMSRPARWAQATGQARDALQRVEDAKADLESAKSELEAAFEDLRGLQEEYQDWLSGLAEVSQGTAMEEKLQAVDDLDLDPDLSGLDVDIDTAEIEAALDEAEAADLPLGFGKD